jgi:hypothetical protein
VAAVAGQDPINGSRHQRQPTNRSGDQDQRTSCCAKRRRHQQQEK